jgi:hypothetical protein
VQNLSSSRHNLAGAGAGDTSGIICFGGGLRGYNPEVLDPTVDCFDVRSATTTSFDGPMTPGPTALTTPRCDHAAAGASAEILFAGGRNGPLGGDFNSVEHLNVTTMQWQAQTFLPGGARRESSAAAVLDRFVLFSGGYTGAQASPSVSDAVDVFDLESRVWSSTSMLGSGYGPYAAVALATVGDRVMFAGGRSQGGSYTDLIWAMDFSQRVGPFPLNSTFQRLSERRFMASAASVLGGSGFIISGGYGYQQPPDNKAEKDMVDVFSASPTQHLGTAICLKGQGGQHGASVDGGLAGTSYAYSHASRVLAAKPSNVVTVFTVTPAGGVTSAAVCPLPAAKADSSSSSAEAAALQPWMYFAAAGVVAVLCLCVVVAVALRRSRKRSGSRGDSDSAVPPPPPEGKGKDDGYGDTEAAASSAQVDDYGVLISYDTPAKDRTASLTASDLPRYEGAKTKQTEDGLYESEDTGFRYTTENSEYANLEEFEEQESAVEYAELAEFKTESDVNFAELKVGESAVEYAELQEFQEF